MAKSVGSKPSLHLERALWHRGLTHIAGVDEAGRGCLAGPVVAAAVVLPEGMEIEGVNDSKKLSKPKRERLAYEIQDRALASAIGLCTPEEIDELNILWAAMEAMRRAVQRLAVAPDHILIDGNRCFPDSPWSFDTIIKGDSKSHTIAAASILAKTTRDAIMRDLAAEYPAYNWAQNVGYPTQDHYAALVEHGITPYHRRSFRLQR